MKRILCLFVVTLVAAVAVQAQQVTELAARQTADKFFASNTFRSSASASSSALKLAYTADKGRFYIFNRGENGGFVVVAGDERVPQVLGYGRTGSFLTGNIPPAMQDWMTEMDREIAYLQSHRDVPVHQPVKRADAVRPMLTTQWDQGEPYNNLCPTYNDGKVRAVTGCVATATAQIMNYHKWPLQGTGSHSYRCNVNGSDLTILSADFSQSHYEWDLMLDSYDPTSSEESCYAVAKLMSDVGISIEMNYGSSSGAQETDVLTALTSYFGYSDRHYLLQRDLFSADEWDQMLMDEISAGRPILYCGFAYSQGSLGGHAFVFDGFDTNGYFHVNWGWGGAYDNYFLVSVLAPSSGNDFKFGQDAIFGIIPAPQADEVADVLYVRGLMHPGMISVPRGQEVSMEISDFFVCGNMLDTVGYDNMGYWSLPYDTIPMELSVVDADGVKQQTCRFTYRAMLDGWWSGTPEVNFVPEASLADGEYSIQIAYSSQKNGDFDTWVSDDYGQSAFCKMMVSDDMVYLSDGTLASKYNLESMSVGQSIFVNEPFDVDVTLSYSGRYGPQGNSPAPTEGSIHLSLLANGQEVATSDPVPASVAYNSTGSYTLQMMAPAQWGRYQLKVVDESGRPFTPESGWYDVEGNDGSMNIVIVPKSDQLVEDFETMTANSKTNETHVQGRFTSWNFNKSGVRAPGEGKCYGTNSVMMKKPSTFYSVEPVYHNFMMAAATFFNNSTTDAKYTLEYSVDNGATWVKVSTIEGDQAAVAPATSATQVIWPLNLRSSDASLFRVSMTGGGSASTYVDDFILRYNDALVLGDVNLDGEINIADVNAVIDLILKYDTLPAADVNSDGEVNIADVNAVIDLILN